MKYSYVNITIKEGSIDVFPQCVFNHDGNLFAAVSENLISIINFRTGGKVELKGHNGKVSMFHLNRAFLQIFEMVMKTISKY